MEIKVGDKVRVSKDVPRIFFGKCDMSQIEFTVGVVDKYVAEICIVNDEKTQMKAWIIPCKYLIKVEDEAKEPKFKKGDKVVLRRFNGASVKAGSIGEVWGMNPVLKYCYDVAFDGGGLTLEEKYLEPYTEPTAPKYKKGDRVKFKNIYELQKVKDKSFRWMLIMFASKEATITAVEDNGFYRVDIDPSVGGINDDMIERKIEPTAPTIKVGDRVCCYNVLHLKGSKKEDYMGIVTSITDMGITVQLDNGGMMFSCCESDLELVQPKEQTEKKPNVGSIKIPVEVDLSDSYWDAYTADLARDIAVKIVNKNMGSDPDAVGEYAVNVAKSVVEELKRK